MRMWMVDPRCLCNKHLIGEHGELHKMLANLRNSRKWTLSLTARGFLEPQNALARHDIITLEMEHRFRKSYNSPLLIDGVDLPTGKVDIEKSIEDLKARCAKCNEKIINFYHLKNSVVNFNANRIKIMNQ